MESNVDKRAGRTFGPQLNKKLIYFMDDLNMPYVDKYGTQSPICLIRQIIDYKLMYDRDHLEDKKYLDDCLFTACMNPKSGSFFIDPRLQRHYSTFSCLTAEKEILAQIYLQILDAQLCTFDPTVAPLAPKIIAATTEVFFGVVNSPQFMPSARKFHYQFNLRDFSRIIQNMMLADPQLYRQAPEKLVRLWAHECNRTYADRLIFDEDVTKYNEFLRNACKNFEQNVDMILELPNVYTSIISAAQGHDKAYLPAEGMEQLHDVLTKKLEDYNENVAAMDLVLFDQAMEHICKIARIIDQPAGNALLIGVGGSGKQSLSKLGAYILTYDVVRIMVGSNYNMGDLKADLQTFFVKAGVAGAQLLFILTDTQIADDSFLVYINDVLSAGLGS